MTKYDHSAQDTEEARRKFACAIPEGTANSLRSLAQLLLAFKAAGPDNSHATASTSRIRAHSLELRAKVSALLPPAVQADNGTRPPLRVHNVDEFRSLIADGVRYSSLDVRGDSSSLNSSDKLRRHHPVAAALQDRRASGSRPGERNDGRRIALAIEGGGMRGCIGAGMVAAINYLGLTEAVDAVYGSSAGSLVGAYLLSRQLPQYGCSIYYDVLPRAGRSFIDIRKVLHALGLTPTSSLCACLPIGVRDILQARFGMSAINLDFLLEEVVQNSKPLDWKVFWNAQSTQPLRVVTSDLHCKCARVLGCDEGAFDSLPSLAKCMRASMLLPGVCGPPVSLPRSNTMGRFEGRGKSQPDVSTLTSRRGDRIMMTGADSMLHSRRGALDNREKDMSDHADAMLYEPIPYRSAIAEGATHVLVLRTVPDGINIVRKQSIVEKFIARRFFCGQMRMPHMAEHMMQQLHRITYAEDILVLNRGVASNGSANAETELLPLAVQRGERGPEISHLQTDSAAIFHAIRCGFARAYDILAPLEEERPNGWSVACDVFPESVLAEIQRQQKKRMVAQAVTLTGIVVCLNCIQGASIFPCL